LIPDGSDHQKDQRVNREPPVEYGNANSSTVAGWTTPFPAGTLLLYLHPTPRPYSHLTQLRVDARAYKPWLFWAGGAGLIILGFGLTPARAPGLVPPWVALTCILAGGHFLLAWFSRFLFAVHCTRTAPLDVGLIRTLKAAPPWPDLAFADAIRADGTVVEVTVFRAIVDGWLNSHGECEVLFYTRPRGRRARSDTGFVIAARQVRSVEGRHATVGIVPSVLHWTGLNQAQRVELGKIAGQVGFPIDAVFFILSALGAVARRHSEIAPDCNRVDENDGAPHVTAPELCRFIPEHAAYTFGGSAKASRVLSAWGLQTGEDVGAVVDGCLAAGWLTRGSTDIADGCREFGPLIGPSRIGIWPSGWRPARRRNPRGCTHGAGAGSFRRSLLMFFLGFCFAFVVLPLYVLWAERLSADERPLVGRWYAFGENRGEQLGLIEFGRDRSLRVRFLRKGDVAAWTGRDARWAAHDGRIVTAPPFRNNFDRFAQALGQGADRIWEEFGAFRFPDADTLDTTFGGRQVVFRRVPKGIASDTDLFQPRR
jgi:uncharacterized repeat protein (TIGR04138 family)